MSDRLSCTRKEGNAMRLMCSSLAYQVLEGFRRVSLAGTKLARATFGEVRMKLFKLAARVRVIKTRVEVHLAAKHPGSSLVAQIIGQALRVHTPRTASSAVGTVGASG
ncbi:MAG: transposase [Prosthecobacter sp.]